MWCAFKLDKSDDILCIPNRWIKDFSYARAYNCGLKTSTRYTVYHSPNAADVPFFDIRGIQKTNISNSAANYTGKIVRFFGKYNII